MARAMKDSGVAWIGEIPADWKLSKVSRLYKIQLGKMLQPVQKADGDTLERYLCAANVGQSKLKTDNIKQMWFSSQEKELYKICQGDLLVVEGGDVASSDIVSADLGKIYFQNSLHRVRPINDCNVRFLRFWLIAAKACGYIDLICNKATIAHFSKEKFSALPYPAISLNEQNCIVDAINLKCDKIDAVLDKTRTSIEEYKKLKQAIITQAVTKGIRGDRPMKNSGVAWIGVIPSEWDVSTLGKFITIDSGISVGKKYELGTPLVEVPYLRVANVQGDHVDLSDVATIMVTPEEAEKYKLKAGQLLMTEGGDRDKLGRGCLWNGEIENCIHQNHVFSVQTNDRLTVRYLDYLTTSEVARVYFDLTAKKTTNLACTNKSTIQKFVIPIPKVAEQEAICDYLDGECKKLDRVLQAKANIIEQLNNYKKSLIYEYVTGKRDVSSEREYQAHEVMIYPYFPAVLQAKKPRFAQAVLMSKVLDTCRIKMGRVKLEKMMFVLENSIGFNFETEYVREAAGPLDKSIYACEKIISKKNNWFTIRKSSYGVSYHPTKDIIKYKKYYDQYFTDYANAIDHIIDIFRNFNADQAEIIATLYGAWNDFIIDKKSYTDDDIVEEVLNNWNDTKRRFSKDVWLRAIQRMRELDLVPQGYGRHTIVKEGNNLG